jgi:hypothetical protein
VVLYQICVFGADLKSNMAARVYNVFSLAEIFKIFDDGRLPMTKVHMAYGQVS